MIVKQLIHEFVAFLPYLFPLAAADADVVYQTGLELGHLFIMNFVFFIFIVDV